MGSEGIGIEMLSPAHAHVWVLKPACLGCDSSDPVRLTALMPQGAPLGFRSPETNPSQKGPGI
eukprot:scaffold22393_cov24-Tisochrysis_lutea.AAC.1